MDPVVVVIDEADAALGDTITQSGTIKVSTMNSSHRCRQLQKTPPISCLGSDLEMSRVLAQDAALFPSQRARRKVYLFIRDMLFSASGGGEPASEGSKLEAVARSFIGYSSPRDRATRKMAEYRNAALGKALEDELAIPSGTDAGVFTHGHNARELAIRVRSLEPGKYVDVIAVAGNPLDDITELEPVRFVMKGGIIYRNDFPYGVGREK